MKQKPSEASTEVTESQDDSRGEDLSDEPNHYGLWLALGRWR